MRQLNERLSRLYSEHPRIASMLAGTALLVALTGVHALISFTTAFRALYVLPIWLATRMGGRRSGLALVVLCTIVGTISEYQVLAPSESLFSNFFIRFGSFGLLMLLIGHVEIALQKHQRMALHDPLTGLLNRHALKEFANMAMGRAVVRQQPLTVVIIDCDGFKQVNDTYGHKAGDHVLMLLAKALEGHTRQTDLVARLGGDEFAVVFQNTDLEEARAIMHRVDEAFVHTVMDAGYAAGLSIGFGSTADGYSELDAIIEVADHAMYQHKQQKKGNIFLN